MNLAGSAYGATFTAPATVSTVSKSSSSLADVGSIWPCPRAWLKVKQPHYREGERGWEAKGKPWPS